MGSLRLAVNGAPREVRDVPPGASLLWLLRERLDLPGTKDACEQGECGSCSVYLGDALVCACLVPAWQADGDRVRTIEGLAGSEIDPIQDSFLRHGAVQCGFCTPGLVMAAHDLIRQHPRPDEGQIREALAGNLCRCTGYESILDAVRAVAAQARDTPGPDGEQR